MRVLSLLLLAQSASVFEMASPSYPRIGAAGRSIGQSEALAAS